MAEVLGVVAVAASLVSFSSSTLLLVKDFVKSIETVKQLEREVIVLQHILTEYGQIVQKVTPLPDSMVACISMCLEKENDLLILLSHLTALSRKKIGRFLVTMKEPELMTTYNAFRDSILLLRDLSADLRMNHQLIQMTIAMAQLGSEYADVDSEEEISHQAETIPADGAVAGDSTRLSASMNKSSGHRNFFYEFATLMSTDWTRSLVLVIQVPEMTHPSGLKFIPVRNKIDTGSDENLVSAELLSKHDMDSSKIQPIPSEKQGERTLRMLNGFTFTPTQEVRLQWHRPHDMRQREDTFVIVPEAPFDVLIGSEQFKDEAKTKLFFVFGRNKSKKEIKEEDEGEEREEQDNERLLKEQLAEAQRLRQGDGVMEAGLGNRRTMSSLSGRKKKGKKK